MQLCYPYLLVFSTLFPHPTFPSNRWSDFFHCILVCIYFLEFYINGMITYGHLCYCLLAAFTQHSYRKDLPMLLLEAIFHYVCILHLSFHTPVDGNMTCLYPGLLQIKLIRISTYKSMHRNIFSVLLDWGVMTGITGIYLDFKKLPNISPNFILLFLATSSSHKLKLFYRLVNTRDSQSFSFSPHTGTSLYF
jgi:hypothetical protein